MDADVSALLKDKRLWAGAAVAAGVGVVMWFKRGGSTPAVGGPGSATGSTQGSADTTGTDIASYLGQYSQSQMELLNQWAANLKTSIDAIGTTPDPTVNNPSIPSGRRLALATMWSPQPRYGINPPVVPSPLRFVYRAPIAAS